MSKKEVICYVIALVITVIHFVYLIMNPVKYEEMPLEYRIRMEQRMIGW